MQPNLPPAPRTGAPPTTPFVPQPLRAAWEEGARRFARNDLEGAITVVGEMVDELRADTAATLADGMPREAWIGAFETLHVHFRAAARTFARDFTAAAKLFESVAASTRATLGFAWPADHFVPPAVAHLGFIAGLRIPLCRAAEAAMVGDGMAAIKHAAHAEAVIGEPVRLLDTVLEPQLAAALPEAEQARAASAFDIYAGFYTDAVPIYTSATAQGVDLDGARRFFERHEQRFQALTDPAHPIAQIMNKVYPVLPAMAGFTRAQRLLVEARIGARRAKEARNPDDRPRIYEAALDRLAEARNALRDVAVALPMHDPISTRLRETALNAAATGVPEIEHQIRSELELNEQIRLLTASDEEKARRLERALADREATFLEIVRLLSADRGVNIDIDNVVDAKAQIQAHFQISHQVHDAVTGEIERLADEIAERLPAADISRLKAEAEDARKQADIVEKAAKVAKLLETFKGIVETGADLVPYGRPVYALLSRIFG